MTRACEALLLWISLLSCFPFGVISAHFVLKFKKKNFKSFFLWQRKKVAVITFDLVVGWSRLFGSCTGDTCAASEFANTLPHRYPRLFCSFWLRSKLGPPRPPLGHKKQNLDQCLSSIETGEAHHGHHCFIFVGFIRHQQLFPLSALLFQPLAFILQSQALFF